MFGVLAALAGCGSPSPLSGSGGAGGAPVGAGGASGAAGDAGAAGPAGQWQALRAGDDTACGLKNGHWYCWGDIHNSALQSMPTQGPVLVPTLLASSVAFRDVQLGGGACGLTATNDLYCWSNLVGLGCYKQSTETPTHVFPEHMFTSIVLTASGMCALDASGTAYCAGHGIGQSNCTGTNASAPPGLEQVPGGPWKMISAQADEVCGVTMGGDASCWGAAESGGFGSGVAAPGSRWVPLTPPTPVGGGHKFQWIKVGYGNACALETSGTLYCWGAAYLGDGTAVESDLPVPITFPAGVAIADVVFGEAHCALATSGDVYCWGTSQSGNLGLGEADLGPEKSPVRVPNLPPIASLAQGIAIYALTTGGARYEWGNGETGALGNGVKTNLYVPKLVP
jgi:alpha-tubulin suppressor-like RCC1 family protein